MTSLQHRRLANLACSLLSEGLRTPGKPLVTAIPRVVRQSDASELLAARVIVTLAEHGLLAWGIIANTAGFPAARAYADWPVSVTPEERLQMAEDLLDTYLYMHRHNLPPARAAEIVLGRQGGGKKAGPKRRLLREERGRLISFALDSGLVDVAAMAVRFGPDARTAGSVC